MTPRLFRAVATLTTSLLLMCIAQQATSSPQPGQWQPGGVFQAPAQDIAAGASFLLLDTGGLGGMCASAPAQHLVFQMREPDPEVLFGVGR